MGDKTGGSTMTVDKDKLRQAAKAAKAERDEHPMWPARHMCEPDELLALLDDLAALEANAIRMREYRFAMEGIETDGNGNPLRKVGHE